MSKSSKTIVSACVALATAAWPAIAANPLDFETRVFAQAAIGEVYWRHRIWPADNPDTKPPLERVLPESSVRAAVEDYLLKSVALESLWGRPIQGEDLRAEVERMAASSRAPAVLQELFAALGHDPDLVAECLARPLLADRAIRAAYAFDLRYHGALKRAIEGSLAQHPSVADATDLGGEYQEIVWTLGRAGRERARAGAGARVVRVDRDSWRGELSRLLANLQVASAAHGDPGVADLPVGVFGRLQQDADSFFVQAVLEKDSTRLRVATVAWRKEPFDAWWARTRATLRSSPSLEGASTASGVTSPIGGDGAATALAAETPDALTSLPAVSAASCTPDTWTSVQMTGAPLGRFWHTAVWTGAEMIVWGGYNRPALIDLNTGGRYDPATNSWTPTSTTGAPEPRDSHTAVWTGTRMVVWGGSNEAWVPTNSGGRYDPATDSWQPTATSGAPSARQYHTTVWTGTRMVVWGGYDGKGDVNTGGRYDPVANSWAATTRTGAPTARDQHVAVWSGSAMLVWGGEDDNAIPQNTGSRYDPVADSWSAMTATGAPAARWLHTAVWTGSRMIVWGGYDGLADLASGGVYDPAASNGGAWTPTSTSGAPAARDAHTAAWIGPVSEMSVWGGQDDMLTLLDTGARYNPTTDTWAPMSTLEAPSARRYHTAVWSGSELIVWGGLNAESVNSGGRYCPLSCSTPPPDGSSAVSLGRQPEGSLVSWTALPAANSYDLVRGRLNQLLSTGGNFTDATAACLANDQAATSYLDANAPPAADGFWYVVRGTSCGGAGTYDETGGSQIGSRDVEIQASPSGCP